MTTYHRTSERELASANIDAIKLLKALQSDQREPTDDEVKTLASYSGWGHSSKLFDPTKKRHLPELRAELNALVDATEHRRMGDSVLTAYYTPDEVAKLMWGAVEHLGYRRGSVIDAGAGNGVFFRHAPYVDGSMVAVECEPIAAGILRKLLPYATVIESKLEKASVPSNTFDVAIGNVPFLDVGVVDPRFPKFVTANTHNYFIARLIDSLRAGGIAVLITSRFTMDSKSTEFREYLSKQADLIGAVRLPTITFKDAHTAVTSDILILRKRDDSAMPSIKWIDSVKHTYYYEEYWINQYYIDHPEMIVGQIEMVNGRFGRVPQCVYKPHHEIEYTKPLELALAKLPRNIIAQGQNMCAICNEVRNYRSPCRCQKTPDLKIGDRTIRSGAYFVSDGTVFINNAGTHQALKLAATTTDRMRRLVSIRDLARDVLALNFGEDAPLRAAQRKLLWQWRMFKSKYGAINTGYNRSLFSRDPDAPLIWSIEDFNPKTGVSKPTEFFTSRVVGEQRPVPTHCDSADDALIVSLAETGHIDWDFMAELTGMSHEKMQSDLEGRVYRHGSYWFTADAYLSGNVRTKLKEAIVMAEADPSYQRNVTDLQAAMPEPLQPGEIVASLSAGWIPTSVVEDFICAIADPNSLLNGGNDSKNNRYSCTARYIEHSASWTIAPTHVVEYSGHTQNVWGTERTNAIELIKLSLNGKHVVIKDYDAVREKYVINKIATMEARAMQRKIKAAFKKWVWEDTERGQLLAEVFNIKFRSTVPREYDGSHLEFKGLGANMLTPHPHQRNMAWRVAQGGNHLLWWSTGFGKTIGMILSGMELRRLGLRRKVVHVTLSNVLWDYAQWFQRAYPLARILVIDSRDMAPKKRQEMLARIATQDWDAVIMTHEAFGKIPIKPQTFEQMIQMEIEALEDALYDAGDDRPTLKDIKKQVAKLEQKLEQQAENQTYDDSAFYFEDLGVDGLFIDEAHLFKNLMFATKRTRVPGISNSDSARAFDMFVKCQYVSRRDTDGNLLGMRTRTSRFGADVVQGTVVFATATPIPNSVCEMYTMQRYLQTDTLIEMGLAHFDSWANTFGEDVTMIEMKPTGAGYRENTRFVRFNNVGELMRVFLEVADIQCDKHKVNIKMPEMETGGIIPVVCPMSPDLEAFIDTCAERMKAIENGTAPDSDNVLVIMGDANKAATDMRLVSLGSYVTKAEAAGLEVDEMARDPEGKIQACIDNIAAIHAETTGRELFDDDGEVVAGGPFNLTQMVFLDTSTPKPKFWSLYHDMRDGLVEAGVPASEIAFIHDAKNDEQKKEIFDKMNTGELRVLIGSTGKMGMGTNAQRLLYAQHNMDPTWRPADEEQRIGRIERQGNLNPTIRVYRYITEGSFDVYMYQTLQTKSTFLAQLMKSSIDTRSIEDIDNATVTYAQFKALATGNPLILERTEIETKLRSMHMIYEAWEKRVSRAQYQLRHIPERIERLDVRISQYKEAMRLAKLTKSAKFFMTINAGGVSEEFEKRADAAAVFKTYARRINTGERLNGFATYRGCRVDIFGKRRLVKAEVHFSEKVSAEIELTSKGVGDIRKIENTFSHLFQWHETAVQQRRKLVNEIPSHEKVAAKQFEHQEEYDALNLRLSEIIAELEEEFKEDEPEVVEGSGSKAPTPPEPLAKLSPIRPTYFNVINQMDWTVTGSNGSTEAWGRLPYQLDRKDYLKVDQHLQELGGIWYPKMEAHYFKCDPRSRIDNEFQLANV